MNQAGQDPSRPSLGPLGSLAVVAGSMLGVGIFLTPSTVAREVSGPWSYQLLWALGGVVALSGAGAYAELGALFPRAGGDYVFLRHTFGGSVAFAAGWLLVIGVFAGSLASMSMGICQYQLPTLLPGGASRWLADTHLGPVSGTALAAIALSTLLTGLNLLRLTISAVVQTLVTLLPFVVLAGVSLWAMGGGEAGTDEGIPPVAGTGHHAKAFLAVYFAYAGWNSLSYVAGEVRNPSRNLPLGLVGGTLAVTVLYLLLGGAYLVVLGLGGLREAFEAGTATAGRLFGPGAEVGMAVLIAVALIGSLNATVLQGSRMVCAMARDRLLPSALQRRDPRHHAPRHALLLQWAFTVVLLLAGTFETLLELTSIAMLWMSGLTVLALFVLRRREPDRPRPYRAMGYPVLPALFLVVMAGVIGMEVVRIQAQGFREAGLPLLGLGLFGVLYGAHRIGSRRPAA